MARHKLIPVAVVVQPQGHGQQVLRALVNYMRQGAQWLLLAHSGFTDRSLETVHGLKPRGVIVQLVACLCHGGILYATERERGFRLAVEGVALSCRTLDRRIAPAPSTPAERELEARSWLRSLPKPCGRRMAQGRAPIEERSVFLVGVAMPSELHRPAEDVAPVRV